jgi:hypothetical protein
VDPILTDIYLSMDVDDEAPSDVINDPLVSNTVVAEQDISSVPSEDMGDESPGKRTTLFPKVPK